MTTAGLPSAADAPAFSLVFMMLAPLMLAGIALINTGLGRSRSAAQSLLGSLLVISAGVLAFAIAGATLADGSSGTGHVFQLSSKPWNWSGTGPLVLSGLASMPQRAQLVLLFEFIAIGVAALIPWGTGADRVHLSAGAACAAVIGAFVFPIVSHWTWGGGWLADLGANFGLGAGFIDAGGAGLVHMLGGISALILVWITGSRRGKFPREGLSTAMPAHNAPYVLFGCFVATIGWLGWNEASALLWPRPTPTSLPEIAINTALSAAAALIGTFMVTRVRFGKPDASLCANGWLAGLVTSCACAAAVSPMAAIFTGLVAGTATPLLVEFLELAVSIDDPSGAIAVHGVGGLWGLLAAGIFASAQGQFTAQLLGIATLLGFVLPALYLLLLAVNRFVPFRVDPEGERVGMDLHELGGGAYPEFVIHRDDSYR